MEKILALPEKIYPVYKSIYIGYELRSKEELESRKAYLAEVKRTQALNGTKNCPPRYSRYQGSEGTFYCGKCKHIVTDNTQETIPSPKYPLLKLGSKRSVNIFENERYQPKYLTVKHKNSGMRYEHYYVCPDCGHVVFQKDMLQIGCAYTTCVNYYLDGNKLKLKARTITYGAFNGHIIPKFESVMYVMNLDSGHTYKMPTIRNGKYVKKEKIINMTYDVYKHFNNNLSNPYNETCKDFDKVISEMFDVIRKYKMEKLDFYVPTFSESNEQYRTMIDRYRFGYREKCTFQNCVQLNRYPGLNVNITNSYICELSSKFKRNIRSIKQDEKDVVTAFLKAYKLPTSKKVKALARANSRNILNYDFWIKVGVINKYDNLLKLAEKVMICEYYSTNEMPTETIREVRYFLRNICKTNENIDETIIVNKVLETKHFLDLVRMAFKLSKEINSYEINVKDSFNEIHDKMSLDYKKIKSKNRVIPYKKADKEIEGVFDNLEFKLAKDTHELITVGSNLGICVGSYGNSAIEKRCTIVVARDKTTKKEVICIELDSRMKSVHQTKLQHNRHPQAEHLVPLMKWIKENELKISTYDIEDSVKELYSSGKLDPDKIPKLLNQPIKQKEEREVERHAVFAYEAEIAAF